MPAHSMILFVSNRCNLDCRFCFEADERIVEVPTVDDIRERLARFDPDTVRNVMFMGAETLLRKDAPAILEMVRGLGFGGIGVATNGTMIDSPERLLRLMDAGLEYLELSIHSLVPERAAFLGGRDFIAARQRRCLQVIDTVKATRALECTVNSVIVRDNVADIAGLVTGIERDFPNVHPAYYIKNAIPTPRLVAGGELASLADIRTQIVEGIPAIYRDRVRFSNVPLCVLRPHYELSGEVVGLVRGDSYDFLDGRQDEEAAEPAVLPPPQECSTCGVRAICSGVYPEQLGESSVSPIAESDVDVLTQVIERFRARGIAVSASFESDPEAALAPRRRRTEEAAAQLREERASSIDVDDFCRLLLGGLPPLGLGGGVTVTALRAPPGRSRVELDLESGAGLELVVHVERRVPGGRWYLATRDVALSYTPTQADVPVARIDHALTVLAERFSAQEQSSEPAEVARLFHVEPALEPAPRGG